MNLNPQIGETLTRIVPPNVCEQAKIYEAGYCQSGTVVAIDGQDVIVQILVDQLCNMRFNIESGVACDGTFLVRPDFVENKSSYIEAQPGQVYHDE